MKKPNKKDEADRIYGMLLQYTERVDKLIEKLQAERDKVFIKIHNKIGKEKSRTITGGC